MFIVMRRILSILAAAFGILMIAEPVWAQTAPAPAPASGLEEIVVTARKRNENFQDVPVTMDVFTSQEIAAAGIESPRDFVAMVPNMTLVETQNIGNSFITIRGISQARNSEPSVAVLVDGVLETNPYEFTQGLYDIQQIEVLKGPQGALYGRDAIGGAIIIHTADPTDHFEASTRVGVGNGPSEKAGLNLSGPLDSAGTLKYRATFNAYNTDGYIENDYLDRKADPYRDYSGRLRLLWTPADNFSADLRFMYDKAETTAYYFIIPRAVEANPFSDFSTPGNANDTTSPIQNNNLGTDKRDILDIALKLDYNLAYGTITSITDFNHTQEIDTGDAYDFRPVTTSDNYALTSFVGPIPTPAQGGPFDESQSQFIDVRTTSQELRFTSPVVGGFSWIAGAYFVHTNRFISTGNLADRGDGVPAVYLYANRRSDQPLCHQYQLRPFWRIVRTTTPGRYLAMPSTSSAHSGNSMWRCVMTKIIGRTPPLRRPSSCRPPQPSQAKCAKRPSVRPSPRARCASNPTMTGRSTGAGAADFAAAASTKPVLATWHARMPCSA